MPRACRICGACADECPGAAIELLGEEWDVLALTRELLKDRSFFERSGGGVTLSGGEPAMQPTFVGRLLDECRERGVQTALDTCGLCASATLEDLVRRTDLVLYDLKLIDSGAHRELTGHGNEQVLANLEAIGELVRGATSPGSLWVRTPLIPGATDGEDNLAGIGRFLKERLDGALERWEICSFNNLCRDKYRRLGLPWRYEGFEPQGPGELERLRLAALGSGIKPGMVKMR